VFDEMYYDIATDRKMVDRAESFSYRLEWSDFGDLWRGKDLCSIFCGEYIIYCTRNDATITFVDENECCSYRYSLQTRELTYATRVYDDDGTFYDSFEQESFLFDDILVAWYQESGSRFSPDDWGEYRLVMPRTDANP
jgi:hypothetical protein